MLGILEFEVVSLPQKFKIRSSLFHFSLVCPFIIHVNRAYLVLFASCSRRFPLDFMWTRTVDGNFKLNANGSSLGDPGRSVGGRAYNGSAGTLSSIPDCPLSHQGQNPDNGGKCQALTIAKQLSEKQAGKLAQQMAKESQSNDPVIPECSSARGVTTIMESHKDLVNSEVPIMLEPRQTISENLAKQCQGTQTSVEADLTKQLEFPILKQLGFSFPNQNKINKKL
ncbi:hypothetical protein ACH5RR_015542 [Cinchona calisaya]|uniref:Uncharacterized protein n=1 Tax=Cinchona calisaya TaxID=153742 RepID=A0ABD2ZYU3_9GENT